MPGEYGKDTPYIPGIGKAPDPPGGGTDLTKFFRGFTPAGRFDQAGDLASGEIAGNREPGVLGGRHRRRRRLLQRSNQVIGRAGAQAGQSAFRADQQSQIARLEAQARGEGPSLARQQAQESLQRGVSAQQALAAGARPGQQAAAARQASQQGSLLAGSVAGASAQGRAQEQLGAMNQLTGAIYGARGQDQGLAGMNLSAEMQQRGLNDAQERAMREMELRNAMAAQGGALNQAALRNQLYLGALGVPTFQEGLLNMAQDGIATAVTAGQKPPGA